FAALVDASPIATRWLWTVAVVAFLAWVAWTVLSLFFPRPQAARTAPRTFLYHVLALLLPGSGLADELWGVLLLVPWSIFGIDLLLPPTGLAARPARACSCGGRGRSAASTGCCTARGWARGRRWRPTRT